MTIQETIDFLSSYSNDYEHHDLGRVRSFLDLLGSPDQKLRFVHVAGTNGKGSTCAMIASILRKAGYKTGLFTSPHILRYNERIQINGEPISDDDLVRVTGIIKDTLSKTEEKVNWFEMLMSIALYWFAEQNTDIVVFEVGLGGLLDGTNVIDTPECAVITNIGLDHTAILGNTLEEIAFQKAAIIKDQGKAVVYRGEPEVERVFENRCSEVSAELFKADFDSLNLISEDVFGQTFDACGYRSLHIPLAGIHQRRNACVVLETVKVLEENGWNISESDIREGLSETVWPVRFEVVSKDPLFIIDGGHNPQCAQAVVDAINELIPSGTRIVFLTGILADKDYKEVISILSAVSSEFVTVTPASYRALSAEDLAEFIESLGSHAVVCASIDEGVRTAISIAGSGAVCCVGSLYLAGEVRSYFSSGTSLDPLF